MIMTMTREELADKYQIDMWPAEKIKDFQKTLLDWFDKEGRDLPWRQSKNPYPIWISEIMLQQTQVQTVIPYFNAFMEKFPTVKHLAEADEDEVLKMWEGLGYYSRARNLHTAAKQIMTEFSGRFPDCYNDLLKLKGVGPYTAAAIASMAFDEPVAAIDGNLMRVFARLFEIGLDTKNQSNRKVFQAVGQFLIDPVRPGDFNQALMDLGATICTPQNYHPEKSPIKEFNASYLNDTWAEYPVTSKNKPPVKNRYFALVLTDKKGRVLIEQRPEDGLLAKLWTYPLVHENELLAQEGTGIKKAFLGRNRKEISLQEKERITEIVKDRYGCDICLDSELKGEVEHVFSHRLWEIDLFEGEICGEDIANVDHLRLVTSDELDEITLPTVQKKMMNNYHQLNLF